MPPVEPTRRPIFSVRSDPQMAVEIGKMVAESGQSALKALLLLNGGAAVAFLTFLGQTLGRSGYEISTIEGFGWALRLFVGGAFLAVATSGVTYISNVLQSLDWSRTGMGLLVLAVIMGTTSLICFAGGGIIAADAFVAAASL